MARVRRFAAATVVTGSSLLAGMGVTAVGAQTGATGAEVCALVSAEVVGDALDATITRTAPSETGTPQCSYEYKGSDGVSTNVVVAVSRTDDDLGGRSGAKAFKYAVKLNKRYGGPGAKYSSVPGVGEKATFAQGKLTKNLIVLTGSGQVLTVAGGGLDKESAGVIAGAAAAQLEA